MIINKQDLAFCIADFIPFQFVRRIPALNPIIPYYHMISDNDVLHVKHLYKYKTIKTFIADIDFLLAHYTAIGLCDFIDAVNKDKKIPNKSFLLTFDDGFREMHDVVAPILKKKGVPAVFFCNSAFTDNKALSYQHKASLIVDKIKRRTYLNKIEDIKNLLYNQDIHSATVEAGILSIRYCKKELVDQIGKMLEIDFDDYLSMHKPYLTSVQINNLINSGFSIGAHSIDHPLYADLSEEEQLIQTIESLYYFSENFKVDCGAFAFPHSDVNVSINFFNELDLAGVADVSFGTRGMIEDSVNNNFQRFSLERPLRSAKSILAFHIIRSFIKKMINKAMVVRD